MYYSVKDLSELLLRAKAYTSTYGRPSLSNIPEKYEFKHRMQQKPFVFRALPETISRLWGGDGKGKKVRNGMEIRRLPWLGLRVS